MAAPLMQSHDSASEQYITDLMQRSHDANTALQAIAASVPGHHHVRNQTMRYRAMHAARSGGHTAARVTYEAALALAIDASKDTVVIAVSLLIHLDEIASAGVLLAIILALVVGTRVIVHWIEDR